MCGVLITDFSSLSDADGAEDKIYSLHSDTSIEGTNINSINLIPETLLLKDNQTKTTTKL